MARIVDGCERQRLNAGDMAEADTVISSPAVGNTLALGSLRSDALEPLDLHRLDDQGDAGELARQVNARRPFEAAIIRPGTIDDLRLDVIHCAAGGVMDRTAFDHHERLADPEPIAGLDLLPARRTNRRIARPRPAQDGIARQRVISRHYLDAAPRIAPRLGLPGAGLLDLAQDRLDHRGLKQDTDVSHACLPCAASAAVDMRPPDPSG